MTEKRLHYSICSRVGIAVAVVLATACFSHLLVTPPQWFTAVVPFWLLVFLLAVWILSMGCYIGQTLTKDRKHVEAAQSKTEADSMV